MSDNNNIIKSKQVSEGGTRTVGYNKTKVEKQLENQIVRNSEILQEHRFEIERLKGRINKIDKSTTSNFIVEDNNKFNSLQELFEKLINIINFKFEIGQINLETMNRVDKVREKYEQLMEEGK